MDRSGRNIVRPGSGSATIPEEGEEHKPKKFELKEKIKEMMFYGLPLISKFPKSDGRIAGIMKASTLDIYRLAARLEKKYYKKTTLEDLDIELDLLKSMVELASSWEIRGVHSKEEAAEKHLSPPPLSSKQRETWARHNTEIGKMIGGYRKYVENRAGNKKPDSP